MSTHTLTLRSESVDRLTNAQMDSNFLYLKDRADENLADIVLINDTLTGMTPSYTAVQQGGGINQLNNKLYLGMSSGNRLLLTVDNVDHGDAWPINITGTAQNSSVPAGTVIHFATTTPPSGFFVADGSAISRTVYSSLFAIVGITYGGGDGVNTFNLPDLRGMFIRNLDMGRGIDGSRTIGSYQADDFASHTHNSYLNTVRAGSSGNYWVVQMGYINGASGGAGGNPGSLYPANLPTGGAETRPKNIALLACIKY